MLACIWGSSFILMKKGMFDDDHQVIFTDRQVGALRMLLASSVLLPFAIRAVRKVKSWKVWLALLGSGICGNFIPAFLFTYAEQGVSSGYAGMLNSFTPIFTLLIGLLFFGNRLNTLQLVGVFIGTIGIVLLSTSGKLEPNSGSYLHIAAIILATFLYGISLNLIKYKLGHLRAIEISALAFFTIFLPSVAATLYFNTIDTLTHHPQALPALGYIAILSIIGTAFAVIVFNRVIALSSTLFASSVTYLIPIVAVCLGFLHHEAINISQIGSMFVILAGVFVANYLPALLAKRKNVKKTSQNVAV